MKQFPIAPGYGAKFRNEAIFIHGDCYDGTSAFKSLQRYAHQRADWTGAKNFPDGGDFNLFDLKGVMCCAIDAPHVQAYVAQKYHLPSIGVEAARYGINKYWQYILCLGR